MYQINLILKGFLILQSACHELMQIDLIKLLIFMHINAYIADKYKKNKLNSGKAKVLFNANHSFDILNQKPRVDYSQTIKKKIHSFTI